MSEPGTASRFASRESDVADMRAIEEFLDEALITGVLNVIRSGKEATVYRCKAHRSLGAPFAAAKVYHSTGHRSFHSAAAYEQGRNFGPGQVRRAVAKRTGFGQEARLSAWVGREFDLLSALNYAGADVPAPYACTDSAILMEYVGDEDGPAPQLQQADFEADDAQPLFDRVLENIELLLRENVVHGDLSAFNILYDGGRLRIIDFPQAVDPRESDTAKKLLERDVRNVVEFFQRHGAGLDEDPARMARNLWDLWRWAEL